MRKTALITTLLTLMLFTTQSALGWGQKGHDVIAHIAQQHLTKKAEREVNRALGGYSMVYYASWMDNLRNDDAPGYKQTLTWHYANVDEGETYESMSKHPNGDIMTALDMIVPKLRNHKELDDSTESDYVKYLVHLIGDLHCPMHAGRFSDRGGNRFQIRWFNRGTNLHRVWDSQFIESARKWSYTEWQENIDLKNEAERAAISQGTHRDWFNETVAIAKDIYAEVEEGKDYSYKYMYDNFYILEQQLRNAGYRLAALLNEIYK